MSTTPRCDQNEIIRALRVIAPKVTELRALDATIGRERFQQTVSGYFDDSEKLAAAAASITSAKGIYFIPNECNPALLARAENRIRPVKKEPTTSDADIIRRRWLPVDCDPVRPSGISSSEAEHEAAIEMALTIRDAMMKQGWPEPISGDSGNGGHLLWGVDLPADDGGLCERCLKALDKRFSTSQVKIDLTTFNPARIWRLYGCVNGKGDSTADRPHRMARMLSAPQNPQGVPMELLKALAAEVDEQPAKPINRKVNGHSFNIDDFIQRHFPATKAQNYRGGRRWQIDCIFNPDHRAPDAAIYEASGGELGFKCSHNSCAGKGWRDLRERLEPGCYDRQHEGNGKINGKNRPLIAPILTRLIDVVPELIQWVWQGRIARGKITLFAGDPGTGKSHLLIDLAASLTTGSPLPDGTRGPIGSVILISFEDGIADTIRERAERAGADLSKLIVLEGVRIKIDSESRERSFNLADIPALRAALEATPDCIAIIIDPVSASLNGEDSHNNSDVRGLLAPLAKLASDFRVAILLVTHLNKSGGGRAMYRAMGSLAFVAAARAAFVVVKDKADPKRRLLLPIKNNLGTDETGFAYSIIDDRGIGRVVWEREPITDNADQVLAEMAEETAPAGRKPVQRDAAAEWLADELDDLEEHPVASIKEGAQAAGLPWRTVQRAANELEVIRHRATFGSGYTWRLPRPGGVGPRACAPARAYFHEHSGTHDTELEDTRTYDVPNDVARMGNDSGTQGAEPTPEDDYDRLEREAIQQESESDA